MHLLASCPAGAISRAMRQIGQSYVPAFNRKHRRTGTPWKGRFKSCLVDSEAYVLTVYRYIELSSVRAAMTTSAADYPWSSASANLGLAASPMLIPHPAYVALSADPCERTTFYAAWLHAGINCEHLASIRRHIQQERAMGSLRFVEMGRKPWPPSECPAPWQACQSSCLITSAPFFSMTAHEAVSAARPSHEIFLATTD
ncbi:transposase [Pseudoxanthomonas sp. JBR18]|uniref:transposase n=1 Tax=Pseudoxanthomonas sp. JBR18 TaxID=2969308 RepID=UPI002FDF3CB2